jgi:excisionase family DNA binding protein
VKAVQERLNLCAETVRQLFNTGKLPSIRIGRRRLVRSADLKAFIEARRAA